MTRPPETPARTPPDALRAVVLFGATATGKTDLVLQLAATHPVEVISCDSRQVYRHLDIGTAKPTAAERRQVPHHLIDQLELHETWNAAAFAREAPRLAASIRARGRVPIVAGGAGFYLHVLREGLFEAPFDDARMREVRAEVATWDPDRVRSELRRRDPERAAQLHPHDLYRWTRALEICVASGRSVTELTAARPRPRHHLVEFHLQTDRARLHARIERRTHAMLDAGWEDEVRALLERFDPDLPAFATLGYPHVLERVRGRIDSETMRERIVRDTRRYARHQEVWFRKWKHAEVLPVGERTNVERLRQALDDLEGRC